MVTPLYGAPKLVPASLHDLVELELERCRERLRLANEEIGALRWKVADLEKRGKR